MRIRGMTLSDLKTVLDWARDEGWNPGVADASAFLAADPDGFFLAEVDGEPAAAISVVNHDDRNAFLGLYICRPEFRGQGYGYALWTEALKHAGIRSVGLDGVPAQQDNYLQSGFIHCGATHRFTGPLPPVSDTGTRTASEADLPDLVAADAAAVGHSREAFASAWFSNEADRQTIILPRETGDFAFATFRRCASGFKIGPLHANSRQEALALLLGRPSHFAAGDYSIDTPEGSGLKDLLQDLGFRSAFETAHMIKGEVPETRPPPYYGVATLELG